MEKNIDTICNDIKSLAHDEYVRGIYDILNVFNEKYLVKVWHKEDADKFFDDVFATLQELNIQYYKISNKTDI